tara:strand:+ start:675 stop:1094 length:420 start_codon:yes stop_codon:yes gene_type:complete
MPNVNALKKFAKKKVNKSKLASNVKANAKKNINRLRVKRGTEKFMAEQKLYNTLLRRSDELANNIVFTPITQRLLSVTPLPMSVKKSIKKASPTTSGRAARRQTAKTGAMVLSRRGIPRGPAGNILDKLLMSPSQRQRR